MRAGQCMIAGKGVLFFAEEQKGMICNSTNADRLRNFFGSSDTDNLKGKQVEVYCDQDVEFRGETTRGLRLRLPPAPQPVVDDTDCSF